MLGLDGMMPVTVHRTWNGKEGTITWWIDDAFDESTRLKEKRQPPNPMLWNNQMYKMRVFAALVGDTDRNLGNVLITNDWKLWMIDFTRAFRLWDELKYPADLHQIDRTLLARLRELDPAAVKAATAHCLTPFEHDAVMKRRDLLVAHFDALVKAKGRPRCSTARSRSRRRRSRRTRRRPSGSAGNFADPERRWSGSHGCSGPWRIRP